jgi:hypothetical protein
LQKKTLVAASDWDSCKTSVLHTAPVSQTLVAWDPYSTLFPQDVYKGQPAPAMGQQVAKVEEAEKLEPTPQSTGESIAL